MTYKLLCPMVSVSLMVLYPTMTVADETAELPPQICTIFRARGCEGCDSYKDIDFSDTYK